MSLNLSIELILQIISIILSITFISYSLIKGRRIPLIYSYIWCHALMIIWSLGQILEKSALTLELRWLFVRLEYSSVCFTGTAWLLLCLLFSEYRILKKKSKLLMIFIVPSLLYISVLTNDLHHLFFRSFVMDIHTNKFGPLFYFGVIYTYIYVVWGVVVLVMYSSKRMGYIRKQTFFLIFAALIPLFSNAASMLNIAFNLKIFKIGYDITPVSFSVSLVFFTIATFKYKFLNIVPIANKRLVENMQEAAMVVDSLNRINIVNRSFMETFGSITSFESFVDVKVFLKSLRSHVVMTESSKNIINSIKNCTNKSISGEIILTGENEKHLLTNIRPIIDKKGELLGSVVTFNDITAHNNLIAALNSKNVELEKLNEQLQEYAKTIEELTLAKERTRFARDVHDTLGHTLTLLIALLEVSSITNGKDPEKTGEKLNEAATLARNGLMELRRSVSGLSPQKLENNSLSAALSKLTKEYEYSGMTVELTIEGDLEKVDRKYRDILYRLCEEALTNSMRHGKAKNAELIIRCDDSFINIFIFDNGCGCKNIKKGFGLTGMDDRIKSINGVLTYGSDGESGFNIHVKIPL